MCSDITAAGVPGGRTRSDSDESGPVQPMSHPATRRSLQLVAQRPAAKQHIGSEQAFDGSEGTCGVTVVQTSSNVHKGLRLPVHLVDHPQARQRGTAQRDQQLLAADLVGAVVQRDEDPVHHANAVRGTTALHEARIPREVRTSWRTGRRMVR